MTYTFIKKIIITTDDENPVAPEIVNHNLSAAILKTIPRVGNVRVEVDDLEINPATKSFIEFAYTCMYERDALQLTLASVKAERDEALVKVVELEKAALGEMDWRIELRETIDLREHQLAGAVRERDEYKKVQPAAPAKEGEEIPIPEEIERWIENFAANERNTKDLHYGGYVAASHAVYRIMQGEITRLKKDKTALDALCTSWREMAAKSYSCSESLQSALSSMTKERDSAYEENRRLILKTSQLRKVENETNKEEIDCLKKRIAFMQSEMDDLEKDLEKAKREW